MPVFEYAGIDRNGKKLKGTVDADNPRAARQKLRSQSIFASDLKEAQVIQKSSQKDVSQYFRREAFSQKELSITTRQMATLFSAGLPLVSVLTAAADQTEAPVIRRILVAVREDVEQGASLSTAMQKHPRAFPKLYVSMIAAGEASGTLDSVLLNLADHLEAQVELMGKVRAALMYPVFMLIVCFAVIMGLFIFVVPKIVEIFVKQKVALPLPTQITMAISNFLVGYWWLVIMMIIGSVILVKWYHATDDGRKQFDKILMKLPIFSPIYVKIYTARVAQTLGTLLNSGVQLLTAMEICQRIVDNVHVVKAISDAREGVREGRSLADEMKKSRLFPSMLTHMIAVGEKSGELESMLMRAGKAYKTEVDTTLSGLTRVLELLLIVVVGCIVLWVVMSVMMPMIDMIDLVQKK